MLNEIEDIFGERGYEKEYVEVSEDDDFRTVLSKLMRKLLLRVSRVEKAKDVVNNGLRALKSFVVAMPDGPEFRLDVEPILGTADSGDLQDDLVDLFVAVGEAAKASNKPIALFIDEAQYLEESEFSALIASCHRVSQRSLPLVVVSAGLPQIAGLAGEAKSYSERLFDFRPVDSLDQKAATKALSGPAEEEGMTLSDEVVEVGLGATDGYPYFIQEYGRALWDIAANNQPTVQEAERAKERMTKALDASFFKVRLDRTTTHEKKFLRALAKLGKGPQAISDVASNMDRKVNSISPTRAKLIYKGLVYSPSHGKICFTVPHFDDFMMRKMSSQQSTV
jgi:predicted transcriptional regulator